MLNYLVGRVAVLLRLAAAAARWAFAIAVWAVWFANWACCKAWSAVLCALWTLSWLAHAANAIAPAATKALLHHCDLIMDISPFWNGTVPTERSAGTM